MADDQAKGKEIFNDGVKNDDGLFTEAPTNYDHVKYKPLKKSDFLADETYLDHQATICHAKSAIYAKKAEKLERNAEQLREFGDPETRKRAMKLQKMRESLAALEASLIEDGVDLTLIG